PNVVLIRTKHLRPDAISAARTPKIAAWAKNGASFERAYASSPTPIESYRAWSHGRPTAHSDDDPTTLQKTLLKNDYHLPRQTPTKVESAVRYLADAKPPFAIFVSFPSVLPPLPQKIGPSGRSALPAGSHPRVQPPMVPDAQLKLLRTQYEAELARLDRSVGLVLDALAKRDAQKRTLVVLVSDLGAEVGERGIWGTPVLFDSVLNTTLIVSGPGVEAGTRRGVTSLTSLFATICELIRIESPPSVDESFAARLRSANPDVERSTPAVFANSKHGFSVRTDRYRYTEWYYDRFAGAEFYDLALETIETKNLAYHPDYQRPVKILATLVRKELGVRSQFPELLRRRRTAIDKIAERVRSEGGFAFRKKGKVTEVRFPGANVSSSLVSKIGETLVDLTDLSLEKNIVSAKAATSLANLPHLEWLNLYDAKIGDDGLLALSQSRSIRLLPVGRCGISDHGLRRIDQMQQLSYLGLRGNSITDKSLPRIATLRWLQGLNLGETKITSTGLQALAPLEHLQKLWIQDTGVDDQGVEAICRLRSLRELTAYGTRISPKGIARIRNALPKCQIVTIRP
ncbi:MAG: hypothetical protein AAF517_11280, partial [Planctomycetota bacterium]